MGTQHASVDPAERDLAAAELDDIALDNRGRPWVVWRDAVLRWHMKAVANARAQAWIPGMAGAPDPVVEEALGRFYRHHVRVTIGHLETENLELRRNCIAALSCLRFYANGVSDAGERAQATLVQLDPHAAVAEAKAPPPRWAPQGAPSSMGLLALP
jgi:hypothetical protein